MDAYKRVACILFMQAERGTSLPDAQVSRLINWHSYDCTLMYTACLLCIHCALLHFVQYILLQCAVLCEVLSATTCCVHVCH